ncbi:MAG: hypothetical protein M3273_04795 [Actinomycetota bacterium]|nr:hypothetical protein [Actinomycetota bacterium]
MLSQDHDFTAQVIFQGRVEKVSRPIYFDHSPVATGNLIAAAGHAGYVSAFVEHGVEEEELPLEVPLDPTRRRLRAAETPGRPMLSGWLLFKKYEGPLLVPLAFEGDEGSWETDIHFLTKRSRDSDPEPEGHISWETEVSPDGTIHLLIHAGLRKRGGYWYVQVSPAGAVGDAFPLVGPGIEDDQQTRRLALDQDGVPFVMWAGRKNLLVSRLEHPAWGS